jgi:hypothetical protein
LQRLLLRGGYCLSRSFKGCKIEFGGRTRPAEQVALQQSDASGVQQPELLLSLNPFGGHRYIEPARQREDRRHNGGTIGAVR